MRPVREELREASPSFMAGDSAVVALCKDYLAGFTAAAVSKTLNAPFNRVVTLLQTQDANPRVSSVNHAIGIPRYTGIFNVLYRVTKEQGVLAHWRGNLPYVVGWLPTQAFHFAFKDSLKSLFPKYNMKKQFWPWFGCNMASGALVGACSAVITYPFHFAHVRLQADVGVEPTYHHHRVAGPGREFAGMVDVFRKNVGPPLYTGLGVSILGTVVYRAAYFGFYDSAIGMFKPTNVMFKFFIAQGVVLSAGLASYPFELVQHRLIMQAGATEPIYTGTLDCVRKIVKTEGTSGLFKGAGARIILSWSGAFLLVAYDKIKELLA